MSEPPTRTQPTPGDGEAHRRSLSGLVDVLVGSTRDRSLRTRLLAAALVAASMLLVGWLVRATGGTKFVFLHAMYVPVTFAALLFGVRGGAAAGLVAGVLLGPLTPLDVASGQPQPVSGWLFRTLFFMLCGVFVGGFADLMRQRLARNEDLSRALSETYGRNLRLFASLVSERDEQTAGHCERVAHNAVVLGRELALPESDLRLLYWAGLLHDLGKIGVPESILRKPGKLTRDEYAAMQRHARLGYDILMSIGQHFEPIAQGVLMHHERWDGAGYPTGAKGEGISLFGRILGVVDVFEAITSHRPYRSPMPTEEALRTIRAGAGTQFDPAIVELFLEAHERGGITQEETPSPLFDTFVTAIMERAGGSAAEELPGRAAGVGRAR